MNFLTANNGYLEMSFDLSSSRKARIFGDKKIPAEFKQQYTKSFKSNTCIVLFI